MQDGKALQAGTSHDLGQNFARAFDVKFQTAEGKEEYVYASSWGVSTRLIGALIMAHGDDRGIVIPPRLATTQLVIIPIYRSDEQRAGVLDRVERLGRELTGVGFRVDDRRQHSPGFKFNEWEQRGVPFRIEIGPRDVDAGAFVLKHRLDREKETVALDQVSPEWLRGKLDAAQDKLRERARAFRDANIRTAAGYDELKAILKEHGGFVRCRFEPGAEAEDRIQNETKATVRVIPFEQPGGTGPCIYSGKETSTEVLFAQAY